MAFSICIDFDGTLIEPIDPPRWRPGAKEAVLQLAQAGHRLILHSCRATPFDATQNPDLERERFYAVGELPAEVLDQWARYDEMRDFLVAEGVWGLFEVWQQPGKPYALRYVDDRAEDPDWRAIAREFGVRSAHG